MGRKNSGKDDPSPEMNKNGNIPLENKATEEEDMSLMELIGSCVKTAAFVLVAWLILTNLLIFPAKIPSGSMEQTIMTGERIFGNRLAYKFEDPERYDIVIFKYPDDESKIYIKRIIGLPGETVTIQEDGVYINDSKLPLSEDFCPETPIYSPWAGRSWTVPEGCYFMMGDNRNNSADSRYWENPYVAKEKILAKAGLRFWPLNKISFMKHGLDSYYYPEQDI